MVNIEDFIKRLEILLDYYSLNASSFADKIGVQRSSLSHLLSGRNKPSLDFILKILEVYPDVDLYWILNGKGTFPKSSSENFENIAQINTASKENDSPLQHKDSIAEDLFSNNKITKAVTNSTTKEIEKQNNTAELNSSEIDKIVIFYKNGTFKSYRPD